MCTHGPLCGLTGDIYCTAIVPCKKIVSDNRYVITCVLEAYKMIIDIEKTSVGAYAIDGIRCLPSSTVGAASHCPPVTTEPHENHAPTSAIRRGNDIPGRLGVISAGQQTHPPLHARHASKLLSHPWLVHSRAQEQDCKRDEALTFPSLATSCQEPRMPSFLSSWAERSDC